MDLCVLMQTYADLCGLMWIYADLYKLMQTYLNLCRLMWTYVEICFKVMKVIRLPFPILFINFRSSKALYWYNKVHLQVLRGSYFMFTKKKVFYKIMEYSGGLEKKTRFFSQRYPFGAKSNGMEQFYGSRLFPFLDEMLLMAVQRPIHRSNRLITEGSKGFVAMIWQHSTALGQSGEPNG